MVYVGSADGNVYCFDDTPTVSTSVWADSNKGGTMWNNETITINGKISATVVYTRPMDYSEEVWNPGLPNATIKASFTTPDGEDVSLETTADNMGYFSFSYSPTDVGDWGWVVYYDGEAKPWITYSEAYSDWNPLSVTSPTTSSDDSEPQPAALPMEAMYAAIAVVVVVLVVLGVYIFFKRK